MSNHRTIYLAGGCFWGTDRLMSLLPGVVTTEAGFANSVVVNPSYEDVCTGNTEAAETVRVVYDPSVTSLKNILAVYFMSIDPTSVNRQGGDCGTQYRTGIYYTEADDRAVIDDMCEAIAKKVGQPLAVEVMELVNFYPAGEYHQRYLEKNPGGYCHISPMLMEFARMLKKQSDKENGN